MAAEKRRLHLLEMAATEVAMAAVAGARSSTAGSSLGSDVRTRSMLSAPSDKHRRRLGGGGMAPLESRRPSNLPCTRSPFR